MSVKDWFGSADLGMLFAIGLGILIFLVSLFGFYKLLLQKRRIRKYTAEAAAKAKDEEGRLENTALTQREEEEGDLFGVRALEKGFTGGVYQSRSNTPVGSRSGTPDPHAPPKKVRIPYGKPNLSGSTLALQLGNPSTNSLGDNLNVPSNHSSYIGSAGARGSSNSLASSMAESSRSSSSNSHRSHGRDNSAGSTDSHSRNYSLPRIESPPPIGYNLENGPSTRGPSNRSGSPPKFAMSVLEPEHPAPAASKRLSDRDVAAGGLEATHPSAYGRGSTASLGDVYDSYYSPGQSRFAGRFISLGGKLSLKKIRKQSL